MAKLVSQRGEEMKHECVYELVKMVWMEENLPDDWKELTIVPIYKKDD